MGETENELFRIAMLIDDLKHEELNVRVNSIRSLKQIAKALGPDRTRLELVPFLDDTSIDDEDEVLLVLAEELVVLADLIGGQKHIPVLLRPLEQLATVEEPTVRDRAIESLYTICSRMTAPHVTEFFVPMLRRMSEKDWFTSRVAACALFAAAYPRVAEETKAEIRGMFGKLSKDETALVRRAAAQSIGKLAQVLEPDLVRSEFLPIFKKLAEDDQDSVRLLAMQNIITFAELTERDDHKEDILMMIFDLAKDKAWRVRWSLAQQYLEAVKMIKISPENETLPRFIKQFVRLLEDPEAEVKTAAAQKMSDVAKVFSPVANMVSEEFIPAIKKLSEDETEFVRSSVASVVLAMAPIVGKDKTVEFLVPIYLNLLKDREPEVRLNLIGQLDSLQNVVTVESLAYVLLPSVSELAKDNLWRIRHSIIQHVPLLAKHLKIDVFNDNLLDLCNSWLMDEVFSIRMKATENLEALVGIYGEKWCKDKILPKVMEMSKNSNYLFRMQSIRCVESLCKVLGTLKAKSQTASATINSELVPLIVGLANDSVPNIRFNVAKCFESVKQIFDEEVVDKKIRPALEKLSADSDHDVRYYAQRTLESF